MYNELGIEEIFKQYKSKVYRLALSITRNEKDAEDIVQNTFLKIAKNLSGFRNESSISTWIYKIAYNEALMSLRKRSSNFRLTGFLTHYAKKIPSGLFVSWPKLPDEQLLDQELRDRIDTAIKHIPIKYRMPLLLHRLENFSVKDAAVIMGLKENSLKTRLHRAYLLIKSEISDYQNDKLPGQLKHGRTCSILTGFVYDYASGRLNEKKQHSFNNHISDCPSCKTFLNSYRKAIRITGALQCQDISPQLQNKIKNFLSHPK
ncbi:MAG: sigma-70 family RNA polymerase sigma factor [Candidatus Omnitrophica bacterium]|nr:sigma-70 family RNA polymerase sigma factor [Candidatus Omnitrophota bacterium]